MIVKHSSVRIIVLLIVLVAVGVTALTLRVNRPPAVQPLPTIDLSSAEPQVRAKIQDALASLAAKPNDAETQGRAGMVLHAHGFADAAITAYSNALLLAPREFRWIYYRGALLESRDAPAALRDLEAAAKLRDDYAALYVRIGRMRTQTAAGDAVAAFRRALLLNTEIGAAYVGLGQLAQDAGDLDTALSNFRSAALIDQADAAAHAGIARVAARRGLNDEAAAAEAAAKRFAGRSSSMPDPLMDRVLEEAITTEAFLARSESARRAGQFDAALEQLNFALRIAPENAYAHAAAARLFGQRGDLETAVAAATRALELKPDLPGGARLLAMALGYQNKLSEAEPYIAAALREDPDDVEIRHIEGVRLAALGRPVDAIGHLEIAFRGKPDDTDVRQALAQAYHDAGRSADAVALLRASISGTPGTAASRGVDPSVALQLGWILAITSDDALRDGAAAEALLRPLVQNPDERAPEVLDALAAALAAQGKFEEAIVLMTEVVTTAEKLGIAESTRRDFGVRLTLYRQNRPYRPPARP
ncbi:MAG: tetratricopeptide repeat protein [Phycisphaerales bacterium]|nr:tetratricopeptide repeat protein [Phycisphaerales bacterium]